MVRSTLASTACVSAPRADRLPPQTLRVTTAGRRACSARQLVAFDRVGFEQKSKHCREFDGEMCGEAAGDVRDPGSINQGIQLVLEMPARDGDTVCGDVASLKAVTHAQRVLQDALDLWGKPTLPMIPDQDVATA